MSEQTGNLMVRLQSRLSVGSLSTSVCEDGKRQVCEGAVLPVLSRLLGDEDIEVRVNAAGVIMYAVVITAGTDTLNAHISDGQ